MYLAARIPSRKDEELPVNVSSSACHSSGKCADVTFLAMPTPFTDLMLVTTDSFEVVFITSPREPVKGFPLSSTA